MAKRASKSKKVARPRGATKKSAPTSKKKSKRRRTNPPFPGGDQFRLTRKVAKSKKTARGEHADINEPFPGPDPFRLDE